MPGRSQPIPAPYEPTPTRSQSTPARQAPIGTTAVPTRAGAAPACDRADRHGAVTLPARVVTARACAHAVRPGRSTARAGVDPVRTRPCARRARAVAARPWDGAGSQRVSTSRAGADPASHRGCARPAWTSPASHRRDPCPPRQYAVRTRSGPDRACDVTVWTGSVAVPHRDCPDRSPIARRCPEAADPCLAAFPPDAASSRHLAECRASEALSLGCWLATSGRHRCREQFVKSAPSAITKVRFMSIRPPCALA
jgi:hypothetical protein